jgi:hypothetical protein
MLLAFNVTATAQEIDTIFDLLADGTIEPGSFDGDTIASLRLTPTGRIKRLLVIPHSPCANLLIAI